LLNWWDAFLLFDTFLYTCYLVVGLNVEFDLFACEGADSVPGRNRLVSCQMANVSGVGEQHGVAQKMNV